MNKEIRRFILRFKINHYRERQHTVNQWGWMKKIRHENQCMHALPHRIEHISTTMDYSSLQGSKWEWFLSRYEVTDIDLHECERKTFQHKDFRQYQKILLTKWNPEIHPSPYPRVITQHTPIKQRSYRTMRYICNNIKR